MTPEQEKALLLATDAGHLLLENGAEIGRVEETMERIASHYGVDQRSFFVLSNGIIATGGEYAKAEFIPIKGTQLSRVVDVNQLSRDVSSGKCSLTDLENRLQAIRQSPSTPWWEIILGVSLGVSSFCILFGGSFIDAAATLAAGLLLGIYIAFLGVRLPRIFGNLTGGLIGGALCILAYRLGLGNHLANMIIGTIIALVPGVPFTNGFRDLANEDYIAGATRLLDAFLSFLCIALGVALALIIDGHIAGHIIPLSHPITDPITSAWGVQLTAAFIGTIGFSALFGAPRKFYLECGITGMLGWGIYLCALRFLSASPVGAALLGTLLLTAASHILSIVRKCPITVFLICGIIPLVPGGGIFWTAYYLVSNQLRQASAAGFMAIKITIAIAGGIIIVTSLLQATRKRRHKPQ